MDRAILAATLRQLRNDNATFRYEPFTPHAPAPLLAAPTCYRHFRMGRFACRLPAPGLRCRLFLGHHRPPTYATPHPMQVYCKLPPKLRAGADNERGRGRLTLRYFPCPLHTPPLPHYTTLNTTPRSAGTDRLRTACDCVRRDCARTPHPSGVERGLPRAILRRRCRAVHSVTVCRHLATLCWRYLFRCNTTCQNALALFGWHTSALPSTFTVYFISYAIALRLCVSTYPIPLNVRVQRAVHPVEERQFWHPAHLDTGRMDSRDVLPPVALQPRQRRTTLADGRVIVPTPTDSTYIWDWFAVIPFLHMAFCR